jgi:MFS family permease
MISAMFCVLGQIIFGLGGYENTFALMLVGRIVFGIGGEVLHASQNTLISSWFKASELSVHYL